MSSIWRRFRTYAIILACGVMALGLVMVIWPTVSALTICYITGALCVAVGIGEIIRYFRLGNAGVFFRFDLTLGICSALVGLLLILHPTGAMAILPIAVGIYMIVESVFCLQLAVELRRLAIRSWWLSLVWGIVGVVLSLLLLAKPFEAASVFMIFIGVALIASGVQSLYLVFSFSKVLKSRDPFDSDWPTTTR